MAVMEHHLPGILTEGVTRQGLPLVTLTDLMTRRPAEIYGIYPEKGSLLPGTDADIVRIRSASAFSLFEGTELTGWPTTVIKGGKIVAKDGEWVADPPPSRVLNRGHSGASQRSALP
jgi:dihydropyrimidinase